MALFPVSRSHLSAGDNAHPIRTESAPSGVTRMAGAKAYAAKLKISPTTTANGQPTVSPRGRSRSLVTMPAHQVGFRRYA